MMMDNSLFRTDIKQEFIETQPEYRLPENERVHLTKYRIAQLK
jgi:hypothetical protein